MLACQNKETTNLQWVQHHWDQLMFVVSHQGTIASVLKALENKRSLFMTLPSAQGSIWLHSWLSKILPVFSHSTTPNLLAPGPARCNKFSGRSMHLLFWCFEMPSRNYNRINDPRVPLCVQGNILPLTLYSCFQLQQTITIKAGLIIRYNVTREALMGLPLPKLFDHLSSPMVTARWAVQTLRWF